MTAKEKMRLKLKKKNAFVALAVAAALAQGCDLGRGGAPPGSLRILEEKAHLLAGPETVSASDAFAEEEIALMRREIDCVRPVVLRQLADGSHGYAHLALALDLKEAIPLLRRNLLSDRYFYGWEGPDYSQEEAYLYDTQYPHHLAYIDAISGLSGKPIDQAVKITPAEVRHLRSEARKANPSLEDPENTKRYCAKWLLIKLLDATENPTGSSK